MRKEKNSVRGGKDRNVYVSWFHEVTKREHLAS